MNLHRAANTSGQRSPCFRQTWQFANCKYLQHLIPATHRRSSAVKEGFHASQLAVRHVINQFLNADANAGFCMCIFTIFKHYFKIWTTRVNHL